jgi:serine phosphatase RsbU (regulator of sigma subunit)
MGRGDAQATCLALRIDADGGATLANAGHVAPYLNGEELPMEGALPLGMFEGAESSVMRFELKAGDKLVLMSDGIVEAMDANGKLFGFERVHELLRHIGSQQPVTVLREHRMVPHRLVHAKAHKPAEQKVVVDLLNQQPL